mgnify:FL=1
MLLTLFQYLLLASSVQPCIYLYFLGIVVGALIRFVADVDQLRSIVSFNQEFFFLVLLPPIIFESGYNMKRVSSFITQKY